ncbi:hypothetical protein JQN72_04525 [Phycicoccus sp. CSK15P-2]|uniref:hypothetical protein n=1 Tax=Phycicoccus sp. CSK15P-2 TaxID=2807627 RepID=UPI00194FF370|nr:hypothetical protein [Phycicoccus sp. CSK15P-2]MBM6403507.1 hypothetical protein [Phycicoccus sp. CSK15P-2]
MSAPVRDVARWRRPEHIYRDIADICPRPGEHVVSVQHDDAPPLDALVDLIGADVTFVSFHAAVSRDGTTVPHFTGATLAAKEANRILVSDPCLAEGVLLAWFAGSTAVSQTRIHEFVLRLVELSGARHVVFFGGSGGGFASLDIARHVPASTAVVANPQTNILNFHTRWWMPYAERCWGAQGDEAEVARLLRSRVTCDLAEVYGRTRPDVDVVYLQNRADEHHVTHHLQPFREAVNGRRLRLVEGDWGPDHTRPPRDLIAGVVSEVFADLRRGPTHSG